MSDAAIGETLRKAREEAELTQDEAAHLLGVVPKTIYRWESGAKVKPRVVSEALRAYAAAKATGKLPVNDVPRGTLDLETATYLPARLRDKARDFVRQSDLIGADDEELRHIDRTLHSDHVAVLVQMRPDGTRRTLAEMEAEFQLQIQAVQRWLELHMEFRGASPAAMRARLEGRPVPDLPPESLKPLPHSATAKKPREAK